MRTKGEITELYNRHADTVWRVCFSFMGNHADAQDMLQETFLRLMRSEKRFESEEHEKAWLIVTASNVCKNALRRSGRETEDLDDHAELAAPERESTGLAEAILALPAVYKDVIYLHYYEGYRTEEIGRLLGRSSATVRSQLARARAKLKELLEEEG